MVTGLAECYQSFSYSIKSFVDSENRCSTWKPLYSK